jgi:hypothetical protein
MKFLLSLILAMVIIPSIVYGIDAKVETVEGDVFQIRDFSMDGRRTFSIDQGGGIGRVDWKEITSFEIKQVSGNSWVEVQFTSGKKDTLRLRQHSFFRGRSDFGQVSIPFEKVKKVSLSLGVVEEKKKEDLSVKETVLPAGSLSQELDRITLRNGDILTGGLVAESLTIRTIYGTVVFKKTDIARVSFGKGAKIQKDVEKDMLFSKYGDKLSGTIPDSYLKMKLRTDTSVSIPREHIQEIEFGVLSEIDQKIPREPAESTTPKSPSDITIPLRRN